MTGKRHKRRKGGVRGNLMGGNRNCIKLHIFIPTSHSSALMSPTAIVAHSPIFGLVGLRPAVWPQPAPFPTNRWNRFSLVGFLSAAPSRGLQPTVEPIKIATLQATQETTEPPISGQKRGGDQSKGPHVSTLVGCSLGVAGIWWGPPYHANVRKHCNHNYHALRELWLHLSGGWLRP